eukprot:TRINITY_DN106497_c0_g1_i1.p1 TRINITY_DN106497_c0_g1~~TRINITY_DN106497_c0_g1_i1.p1  ORF type:complete len:144 (+),score=24.49 TRINITY_DN106497_c0_g1_i1:46-432(+)
MAAWGHAARWARCRNAQISAFARQVNLGLQGHRGLASCPPLTRICAELRPAQGFVEQRTKTPSTTERLTSGEALDDVDGIASQQLVAAILEGIAAAGTTGCSLSELFEIRVHRTCTVQGISTAPCWQD